jgi:flagellar biosynthesis/type III secretory pathway protein FliH
VSENSKTYEDGYRDGFIAGYGSGRSDGEGQGYSDAKYRAHLAVKAAKVDETARREIQKAMVEIVGMQK